MKEISDLQKKDLKYNWHPYVQHKTMPVPRVIVRGKDALLWDEDGNEYIDGIASWWANPHGHAHPYIAQKISEQLTTLEHVLFGGFTHPSAIKLSEELITYLPDNQKKVFYSDNGSTSVEVAIKMALQYYYNQGNKKNCVIAFQEAFHGDTFAAMAVSGIGFFTQAFGDFLLNVERLPLPNDENIEQVCNQLENIIQNQNPAAFIFEPLVQGAAGMRIYKAEHLDRLVAICKKYGVLSIADEVMTGFGRTGKLFASNYLNETPDIFCLSKALTGGFIPLSATTCTQEIFDAFYSDDGNKALFHGHTFMANPAGCAAALASLELSVSKETQLKIRQIEVSHQNFVKELKHYPQVKNIATLGVILRLDLKQEDEDYYGNLRNELYHYFMSKNLIMRPLGNTIYILPPYCITAEQLDTLYKEIINAIKKWG